MPTTVQAVQESDPAGEACGSTVAVRRASPRDVEVYSNQLPAFVGCREESVPKAIFVKPLCWNDRGYAEPAGCGAKSGYVAEHGYGHEEWNNSPNRLWRGWRVFHTQAPRNTRQYGKTGELGLLMIASHDGDQWILGIACGVRENTQSQREQMARELRIFNERHKLWQIPRVREAFGNDSARFLRHWKQGHSWIFWRAEPALFHWFPAPIKINPSWFNRTKRLLPRHGLAQAVTPEQVVAAIGRRLSSKPRIRDWLRNGEFDRPALGSGSAARKPKNARGNRPRKGSTTGSNSAADSAYIKYLERQEIRIDPRHKKLQRSFAAFLTRSIDCKEVVQDQNYVDISYVAAKRRVICEVKPSDKGGGRYEVRSAVGQLLEYRYRQIKSAEMMIVLGARPAREVVAFAAHCGINLAWPTARGEFHIESAGR